MQQGSQMFKSTEHVLRQYLRRHQRGFDDSDATLTFSEMKTILERDFPDAIPELAHQVAERIGERVKDLDDRYDTVEGSALTRQGNIERARQDFHVDAPDWLDNGIRPEFHTLVEFKDRPEYPDVKKAGGIVVDWVMEDGPGILVIFSAPGNGKSHLTEGAALALMKRGADVIYRTDSELYVPVRAAMGRNDGSAEKWIEAYCKAQWLIIDDFGTEPLSPTMLGVQDRIINERWRNSHGVRTMLTTNLGGESLPARIADRLRDKTHAVNVTIKAESYRTGRIAS